MWMAEQSHPQQEQPNKNSHIYDYPNIYISLHLQENLEYTSESIIFLTVLHLVFFLIQNIFAMSSKVPI